MFFDNCFAPKLYRNPLKSKTARIRPHSDRCRGRRDRQAARDVQPKTKATLAPRGSAQFRAIRSTPNTTKYAASVSHAPQAQGEDQTRAAGLSSVPCFSLRLPRRLSRRFSFPEAAKLSDRDSLLVNENCTLSRTFQYGCD